jgi:hypothetical protein
MSWFDNLRVELAMRSVLTSNVGQLIDRLELEYNNTSTSEKRKEDIFRQGQDAVMVATLVSMHQRGQPAYTVAMHQAGEGNGVCATQRDGKCPCQRAQVIE